MRTIGFIGCGNMGTAMISGILKSGITDAGHVIASVRTADSAKSLSDRLGISVSNNNPDVAERADILFLAVKPYMFDEVIAEIRDVISDDEIVVSIAAGQTIGAIRESFGRDVKLVRAMPNTPAMVGEAMSAIVPGAGVEEDELVDIVRIFESFGQAEVVTERLMDAVIGVSGSSPAYVYMFIEAMADAAVADGMPRTQAYKFAAQSVLGAAKMVIDSGSHPGELKDAVCSPGGTTIEAVDMLERLGFRGTVMAAQRACSRKSKEMSGE